MDGYAFRLEDIIGASESHPVSLPLHGVIHAGDTGVHHLAPNTCMRIFTGAPTPHGADVVIMQENTTLVGDQVTITKCPNQWKNIRRQGEEVQTGTTLLKKGTRLDATIGSTAAWYTKTVFIPPRIGVFSTGDELRNPKEGGTSKQVKFGNQRHQSPAMFQEIGIEVKPCGIARDTIESTQKTLLHAIQDLQ